MLTGYWLFWELLDILLQTKRNTFNQSPIPKTTLGICSLLLPYDKARQTHDTANETAAPKKKWRMKLEMSSLFNNVTNKGEGRLNLWPRFEIIVFHEKCAAAGRLICFPWEDIIAFHEKRCTAIDSSLGLTRKKIIKNIIPVMQNTQRFKHYYGRYWTTTRYWTTDDT